jgi:hypothetical protein
LLLGPNRLNPPLRKGGGHSISGQLAARTLPQACQPPPRRAAPFGVPNSLPIPKVKNPSHSLLADRLDAGFKYPHVVWRPVIYCVLPGRVFAFMSCEASNEQGCPRWCAARPCHRDSTRGRAKAAREGLAIGRRASTRCRLRQIIGS